MSFESFLGNAPAVRTVREMLASDRVPGALLFAGPEGVGKRTLAVMLAKALNCERRPTGGDDYCGECVHCRQAEEMLAAARDDLARRRESKDAQRRGEGLIYFDLQLIEPMTRYILIEQVRQMRAVAYTRPFEFSRRIFIVDQAQAVHWQAVDLLLKMLEEPPETTTIVLVCPNAYELRPTIRSRCTRVPFVAVEQTVISELLAQEQHLNKAQKLLGARVAAGSIARAKAFDFEGFERRRKPWVAWLESLLAGGRPPDGLDYKSLFDASKALTEHPEDFEEELRIGYTLLRDILIILETGPERELVNIDLVERLRAWAKRLGLAGLEKLKAGLDQAYRLATRNVNQQLGLDSVALEVLAGFEPVPRRP